MTSKKSKQSILDIIKLIETDSTNKYAAGLIAENKVSSSTLIYTLHQNSGKGLGKNTWHSQADKNLLFSLVVFYEIKAEEHFKLNMIVSLAICEFLLLKGIEVKIKWPNDIYCQNRKIAGILIENNIYGNLIKSSVIGVGLNLNQTEFPQELENPISLKQIKNTTYDIDEEVKLIAQILVDKIEQFKAKSFSTVIKYYNKKLYRFGLLSKFKDAEESFSGYIKDVNENGHLIICDQNSNTRSYNFKEVEFLS
jgi:BirA family biotin operon repressor/biotin-[acetyl-CoA-carboxylase] ligase